MVYGHSNTSFGGGWVLLQLPVYACNTSLEEMGKLRDETYRLKRKRSQDGDKCDDWEEEMQMLRMNSTGGVPGTHVR